MKGGKEQNWEPMTTALAWLSLLLPPTVWALAMEINFSLTPLECYGGSRLPLFIVNIIALVLSICAGLIGIIIWKSTSYEWSNEADDPVTRNRFLAVLGILASGTFTLVILAQGIAIIFFHPCWR